MIITRKKELAPNMWVMQCPLCGKTQASAMYRSMLPEFTSCNCDKETI